MKIYKIKPKFINKPWGNNKASDYGFNLPKDQKIGQVVTISGDFETMTDVVLDKEGKTTSLKDFFFNNRDLFNGYMGMYPLTTSIISTNDDLPPIVNADDEYAMLHNHSMFKPSAWFVLDAQNNASIVYGHAANTKEKLASLLKANDTEELLKRVNVKPHDFIYLGPNKIHGLGKDLTVFQIERLADATYEITDEHFSDVVGIPDPVDQIKNEEGIIWNQNSSFGFAYIDATKTKKFEIKDFNPYWLQWTVISGKGTINHLDFKQGESAIGVKEITDLDLTGDLQVLVSWVNKLDNRKK